MKKYIKPIRQEISLVILNTGDHHFEEFILQETIKLKRNMCFNFVSLSEESEIEINFPLNCEFNIL